MASPMKVRVLVVDDLEDYRNSLKNALEPEFEVLSADSKDSGQELMTRSVDVVLIDIRLSETDPSNRDGLFLLEWLRMNFPDVPAVMMSAYQEFDLAVEALNLGASFFLRKPINLVELEGVLRKLVGTAGA